MFVLKKIVSRFFFPLPLVFELFLLGLALVLFTRKRTAGRALMAGSAVLLFALSSSFFSQKLIGSLEKRYAPLCVEDSACKARIKAVGHIVVLGGGHNSDRRYPITDQINEATMVRVAEAVRLHGIFPDAKIIFSGGSVYDPVTTAEIMARTSMVMGLDSTDIQLSEDARDTQDEAIALQPVLKTEPFLLVTTASHMPRSMAMFRKKGMRPIAAPVGFKGKGETALSPDWLFPSAGALKKSETAFYEYIGLVWGKLRGQV